MKRLLIDANDTDLLKTYKWHKNYAGYVISRPRTKGVRRIVYLHRLVLERIIGRELQPNEYTDHINHDRSDNRRSNLRLVTRRQNILNNSPFAKSGFKGVYASGSGWVARLTHKGDRKYLGYFKDPTDAAVAYDNAVLKLNGEYAYTNGGR